MALISNPELFNSSRMRALPISLEAPVTKRELIVPDGGYFIIDDMNDNAGFYESKPSSHKPLDL